MSEERQVYRCSHCGLISEEGGPHYDVTGNRCPGTWEIKPVAIGEAGWWKLPEEKLQAEIKRITTLSNEHAKSYAEAQSRYLVAAADRERLQAMVRELARELGWLHKHKFISAAAESLIRRARELAGSGERSSAAEVGLQREGGRPVPPLAVAWRLRAAFLLGHDAALEKWTGRMTLLKIHEAVDWAEAEARRLYPDPQEGTP